MWEYIYWLLVAVLDSIHWGMSYASYWYWNGLYTVLGGPETCTGDLDTINQAEYVIRRALDWLTLALGYGDTLGIDPCNITGEIRPWEI